MNKREKKFVAMALAGALGMAGLGLLHAGLTVKPQEVKDKGKPSMAAKEQGKCSAPDFVIIMHFRNTGEMHPSCG